MTPPRPRAVIAHYEGIDLFSPADRARLDEVVDLLDPDPIGSWDGARAAAVLAEVEVVVGHWGCPRLDADVLARAPRLGLVAYAAGTVRDVVTPAVFEAGIRVTSGAAANAEPVAEFTLATILLAGKDVLWRRLADGVAVAPDPGTWGNWDKVIGLVGASLVGRRVIELLRPFPTLQVRVYDPFLTAGEAADLGVAKVEELVELCAAADVLSIHAPELPATRGMVGRTELAALRDGATLINTARGALVDHDALLDELTAGRLRAVLDVTDPEPLPAGHPLLRLPNAFLTPHLAGSEGTELARLTEHAADEVRRWCAGSPARHEVRADQLDRLA